MNAIHPVRLALASALLCAGFAATSARAEGLLGLYVGGAVGSGSIAADSSTASWWQGAQNSIPARFRKDHGAWVARVGLRPLPVLAVEAEYFDLGQAHVNYGAGTSLVADLAVKMKGTGLYALVYLPIPVLDVYGKIGTTRVQGSTRLVTSCGVATCVAPTFSASADQTDTGLAIGAGVGAKLGSLAVRGEYLRFSALGAYPSLVTVGASWSF